MKMNLLSSCGTIALAAAVAIGAAGCRTKAPQTNTYTGLLSGRSVIPPAYAEIKPIPATSAPAAQETQTFQGIGEENAFVVPGPELTEQPEIQEIEAPQGPEAPVAPEAPASSENKGWTLPAVPATTAAAEPGEVYVVRGGDSLSRIAATHGVKTSDLLAANPQVKSADKIFVGQKLNLPAGAVSTSPVKKADAKTAPAKSADKKKAPAASAQRESIPADGKYTVKSGDSLWIVGHRFGVKTDDIRRWNDLSSDTLQVGQVLSLTGAAAPEAPKATPAPAPVAAPAAPVVDATAAEPLPPVEAPAAVDEAPAPAPAPYLEHAVGMGETLESIASMYETTVEAIKQANPQVKTNADLKDGSVLQIPSAF